MGFLLNLFGGSQIKLIIAAVALLAFIGMGVALKVQTERLDTSKREFAAFEAQVKALGDVAEAKAKEKELADKALKVKIDNENQTLKRSLADTSKRLRDARAGSSFLPSPSTGPASPTVTADRAGLETALRTFDTGVAAIVDQGDQAIADLNSAKAWVAR